MEFGDSKINRRNRSSDFMIKITSQENTAYQGTVEHIQSGQVQYFRSLLEMLHLMHQKLEDMDFPQATTRIRSWKE
ncbi:MAG: hypothetical protein ACOX0F_03200 [Syntrophomonadaceae bacterium]|jgi:hypothetical protein